MACLLAKVAHAHGVAMVSMLRAVVSTLTQMRVARAASLVVAMLALTLALVTTPGCDRQTDRIPRIGFLGSVPSSISDGFREGLKELNLAEGRNINVEWRWTEGKPERIPELAAELDAAFDRAAHSGANAIVVLGDPLIYVHRVQVEELAARQRSPAVYFFSENVDAGGLMSNGAGA